MMRSKHIDVRHHFLREKVIGGQLILNYKRSEEMAADFLTKTVTKEKHQKGARMLGLSKGLASF